MNTIADALGATTPADNTHLDTHSLEQWRNQLTSNLWTTEQGIREVTLALIAREVAIKHPEVSRIEFDSVEDADGFFQESFTVTLRTGGVLVDDETNLNEERREAIYETVIAGLTDHASDILARHGRGRDGQKNTRINIDTHAARWV